ncbi:[LysW]-lysine hydrolase [Halocalculus aciditolerans]|uniref:Putative [LysW]-lysine/[LysW]-ornithine hydrolase n=1 Tax=Halocalculus aciditolerans TaxID=1383812 RepID=A0A830FED6_9EURY|nr:[LysW]-lysine hydrolase [Halocalculus aciditolerans]GGL46642.1 N-acetyl-lysine deacetylase [Halocalculus aciditolerans]
MTDARTLLRDLVEIPSVSGEEDACCARLVEFFEEHDREVFRDDVGNVRAPADDRVLLTSHIDTVPGDIPVREASGELWGRGSVDAKGPLAAMAAAAVRTGVSFAAVVGEEADSRGARHLVDVRDEPAAVVNGEPSGWNAVTLGYRGLTKGAYTAETDSEHTSRPEPNALEHAMAWWARVSAAFDAQESVFEEVTAKPVSMRGGVADDGLAFEASVDASFRVPPSETVESVQARVDAAVESGQVEWTEHIPPVMTSPRSPVAGALRAGIRDAGGEPAHLRKTGTSDMNIFHGAWSCPMATYGPGDSDRDHAPDERIALDDFDRAVDVLETAAQRL